MVPDSLIALGEDVVAEYTKKGIRVSLAESCTGGLCSALITTIPGSSKVLDRAFVTYSNESKVDLLGVDEELLDLYGAVSSEVAHVMAEEALIRSSSNISLSATGIAGPGGGTEDKPVGLVYIGRAAENEPVEVRRFHFKGDRRSIRVQTVSVMLEWLMES